jgi:hypothetical protein
VAGLKRRSEPQWYLSHQGGVAWGISVGIGVVRDHRDNVARVSFSALGAGPFQEAPFEQSGRVL